MEDAFTFFKYFNDYLVKQSWISSNQSEFISTLLKYVYDYVKESYCTTPRGPYRYREELDVSKIEACRSNLYRIIDLLEQTNEERQSFLRTFPTWERHREESIRQLKTIADDLHKERKGINVAKIITSGVGIVGSVAIVGSIFFPPAAIATLPAWLGGSTVAAFLPSFLLPTAVPAVSSLAVGGGVAAAASGVSGIGTAVVEGILIKKHLDDAKDIIAADEEHFHVMKKWVRHSEDFIKAIEGVLDFNFFEVIFKDFDDFYKKAQILFKLKSYRILPDNLAKLFDKICKTEFKLKFPPEFLLAIIGILFVIFLILRQNRILLGCIAAAGNLANSFRAVDAGLAAASAATAICSKGAMAGVKRAPKVLVRDITLGAFAGIGIALDVESIVKSTVDMAKGSVSDIGKEFEKVVGQLTAELQLLKRVQRELQNGIMH